jgi:hypothetical protein
MPGHSRSKNGVASLAYAPGTHVLAALPQRKGHGRDEPGHDGGKSPPGIEAEATPGSTRE